MRSSVKYIALYVLFGLLLVATFKLGLWQLDRRHEKIIYLAEYKQLLERKPVSWHGFEGERWQRVQVSGKFIPHHLLWENQYRQGRRGWEVITPLQLTNGSWVLVNRGFISLSNEPQLITSSDVVELSGHLYLPDKPFILGEPVINHKSHHQNIQALDIPSIGQALSLDFSPYVLRLDASIDAFDVHWYTNDSAPHKHLGYAVQWFGLSLILLVGMLILWRKKL